MSSRSTSKNIVIFSGTIILGFILFILPNIFFGVFKINGGLSGINLAIVAIFQLIAIWLLISFSLRSMHKNMEYIGLSFQHWQRDVLLGLFIALLRGVVVFGFVIPMTGGAERPDIQEVINALDGTCVGLISLMMLGVLGGGIAEEIYNRGFFITVMKDLFKSEKTGLWIAVPVSILFFSAGHMPTSTLLWIDILVASIIYTFLFLGTGRLTASMVSHASWNALAIVVVDYMY